MHVRLQCAGDRRFQRHQGQARRLFQGCPGAAAAFHRRQVRPGAHPAPHVSAEGEGPWFVFASYGGNDSNPDWFHNLKANPDAAISIGDGTEISRIPVKARIVEGEERDRIYARQASLFPQFADYKKKTTRTIPVVELTAR
ncbi:nitroreductase/quinone reductase family protein [Devosia elaeis]|uniref:nitroreductase/quinone reductase family protein n=1 Tax=Devosia elaeis TaxID=1770058 RepID=UPI000AF1B323|nr:nitroreductase/quinone reductase family protein [Devosia elaeis]